MQIEMSKQQAEIVKALLEEGSKRVAMRVAIDCGLDDPNENQKLALTGVKLMRELARQIGKKLEVCK